jgi:hypothetical protein
MIGHGFYCIPFAWIDNFNCRCYRIRQRLTRNLQVAMVESVSEQAQTEVEKMGSEDSGLLMRIHLNGFQFIS